MKSKQRARNSIMKSSTPRRMSMMARIVVVVGVAILALFMATNMPISSIEKTEGISCTKYCQKEFGTDGILERVYKNLSANPGRSYSGPWKCICLTEKIRGQVLQNDNQH